MNLNYLFPHRYKMIGWFLLVPGILLGILYLIYGSEIGFFDTKVIALVNDKGVFQGHAYFNVFEDNVLDELSSILLIIGGVFVAFSKQKNEDEYISSIRLESLVWATYVNYFILLLAILFVYGMPFFWVLVFNMFTLLLCFIIRFQIALYQLQKSNLK